MDNFRDWIYAELGQRGWSQADLARASGITSGGMSRLLSEQRVPSSDTCLGIARAFDIPPETVLRKAGLLPPLKENNERTRELKHVFDQLDNHHQELALRMVRSIREQQADYDVE